MNVNEELKWKITCFLESFPNETLPEGSPLSYTDVTCVCLYGSSLSVPVYVGHILPLYSVYGLLVTKLAPDFIGF